MKCAWLVVCIAVVAAASAAVCATPALALVPDGAHGWFWQMPQPAGGLAGFSALAFPDAGNIWAVGAGGLVLHSGDAGGTWAAQSTGVDADLWSVSFPDARHGWACGGSVAGSGGVIVATTDGGATWQNRTPAGLKETLTDASFTDAVHGWIGTADDHLLRTTDGGASWVRLKVGVVPPPSPYDDGGASGYVQVDFTSARQGWASTDNALWTTADGGKTWMPLFDGLSRNMVVAQIDFVDPAHGWVLAYSQDSGASRVIATSNGGSSWHTVPSGDSFVGDIDATSATDVWLLDGGASPFAGFSDFYFGLGGSGQIAVLHSTDGGSRWQRSSVGSPFFVSAIAAYGKNVCAVGDGMLTSGDAGETWRSATSGQEYAFTAATALSATDIWAVDASGAVLHSIDGSHWVESSSAPRWTSALYGVSFPDASDGWVVGASDEYEGSVILHTSDGGATWVPQASNLSGELSNVDFVDAQNGWAVSDDGLGYGGAGAPLTVEHTTDGGATWVPQYVYDNADLYGVDFISDTTGWVCGDYRPSQNSDGLSGIFATTNSGLTWVKEKLPSGAPDMTGLQFLGAGDGWAVGTSYDDNYNPQEGWVLHSTDGGKTWARVPGLADSLASTVHFSDAADGWIGGLNGVYATTDGGATWQRVAGGYGIQAIAATGPGHVWAFGYGFLVSPLQASDDTAAPVTLVNHSSAWYRKSATVDLSANDIGGSGVASTEYSTDGGESWQTGTSVAIDAPADHANDGDHTILYRSTNGAGIEEQTESISVGVDTLGPACSVPRRSVADAGKTGTLYFNANDALSSVAQVTVSVVDHRGRVLRRFVERASGGDYGGHLPYEYLRFKCALKPGSYRVVVRATDTAGNPQCLIGRGTFKVVRHGAPAFHDPGWPAGLATGFDEFAARLSHDPQARRVLRLRMSMPASWRVLLRPEWGK